MLNSQSIIKQLEIVESSVYRAKLAFEIFRDVPPELLNVSRYEILKAIKQLENALSEIETHQKQLKPTSNEHDTKNLKRL